MAKSMTDEDRIRHYISLSLDAGASPAERDLAAQRAERLMVRLGIESIPDSPEEDRPTVGTRSIILEGGSASMSRTWVTALSTVVAAFEMQTFFYDRRKTFWKGTDHGMHIEMVIVGIEDDLDQVAALCSMVMARCALDQKEARRERADEMQTWTKSERDQFRTSFAVAFGEGVASRIRKDRASVVDERDSATGGSTSLVLRSRESMISNYLLSLGKMRKSRGTRSYSHAGYSDGFSAGQKSGLGVDRKKLSTMKGIER